MSRACNSAYDLVLQNRAGPRVDGGALSGPFVWKYSAQVRSTSDCVEFDGF